MRKTVNVIAEVALVAAPIFATALFITPPLPPTLPANGCWESS